MRETKFLLKYKIIFFHRPQINLRCYLARIWVFYSIEIIVQLQTEFFRPSSKQSQIHHLVWRMIYSGGMIQHLLLADWRNKSDKWMWLTWYSVSVNAMMKNTEKKVIFLWYFMFSDRQRNVHSNLRRRLDLCDSGEIRKAHEHTHEYHVRLE